MNIVLTKHQFNKKNIYFYEPIENTIIENSKFIKIIYSNEHLILNGLFILLNLNIKNIENYFKKVKLNYDIQENKDILYNIYQIEREILNSYEKSCKKKIYNIFETLNTGYIKIYPINDSTIENIILKISGIWESESEYGLTFKFLTIS